MNQALYAHTNNKRKLKKKQAHICLWLRVCEEQGLRYIALRNRSKWGTEERPIWCKGEMRESILESLNSIFKILC
jgi:hypothetical protein